MLSLAGVFLFLIILTVLMLVGVTKQRHLLMAPFVIICSLVLGGTVILHTIHLIMDFRVSLYLIQDLALTIGVQIMSLYPIYTYFMKLRLRSLKEKSLQETCEGNEKKR
ncbi:hypothetical protein FF38_01598 [Lucilia cuprina]|uniref:Uncharacterized protein n=1 Tax=Lucilia cuprina TaxID=7375 RepID=A0A0L0CF11_LUCCU|nr:hypothetical protein CVS40_2987 [Lucilia cuprina]KNC30835.1 hypothetical protein FF38_01598 [Lucilia cuprina]